MSGGAAGCRVGGRNQGESCSEGGPGAAGAAAAGVAAARPPRDATLKAWTPPAGPAGGEPRKTAELPRGCCRFGSSRGTSVARPRRWEFALA